ncbi:MAG: hypothetical protein K2W82_06150 [Candidatus Obscuribacterales bacterium]|nr:hypothetical protein [Candidatus Obscuribacterales bacterium]
MTTMKILLLVLVSLFVCLPAVFARRYFENQPLDQALVPSASIAFAVIENVSHPAPVLDEINHADFDIKVKRILWGNDLRQGQAFHFSHLSAFCWPEKTVPCLNGQSCLFVLKEGQMVAALPGKEQLLSAPINSFADLKQLLVLAY